MADDIQVIDAQENVATMRATGLADGRKLPLHGLAGLDGAQVAPVSSAQVGNPTDAAWDGAAASAGLVAILKRLAAIIPLPTAPAASALSGGVASTYRLLTAAASTNGASVKAGAGRLYHVTGQNNSGAARYLKFYNKATAPTVGTDAPVRTVFLPPLQSFVFDFPLGLFFSAGIAIAITTGRTDADTGALTANDIECLNLDYM